jgi:catechol 2,3-dioxygenase-like lactoylglutathione lyase family enzyme
MATRKPARRTITAKAKAKVKTRTRTKARTGAKAKSTTKPPAAPAGGSKAFKERRGPETLRLRAITPSLTVDDLKVSLAFYTDVLGFIVGEYWTDDQTGQPRGAMLKAGACELGLSQDDWKKGHDRKKGEGVRFWCETIQDVDALAARVKEAGVALTEEPKDEWGQRSFSLVDPNGYRLTIARLG